MGEHIQDWLLEEAPGWPKEPPENKIDTHHHFVPEFYAKAIEDAGGDPSGWPTPSWSAQHSEHLMKRLGVRSAILSITAPGPCILKGTASHDLARKLNQYAGDLRDKNPEKFGFFASLPDLLDTEAALAEITYALDTLHADGVVLFTRYGDSNTYLGNPSLEPIWEELNRRKCVVFVHPTHPVDTNKISPQIPQPMVDYPHETTRTVMDMIFAGTRSKYPDCKVILPHAGGTLPYIIGRVATPLSKSAEFAGKFPIGLTYERVMGDFRSFYYDVALSSTPQVLELLLRMVPHDQILYGSDFPYAPPPSYPAFLENFEDFEMEGSTRDKITHENAQTLFPRFQKES